jgi:aldose sugar dehydrogenase
MVTLCTKLIIISIPARWMMATTTNLPITLRQGSILFFLFMILVFSAFTQLGYYNGHRYNTALGQKEEQKKEDQQQTKNLPLPTLKDPNLKVEVVFKGLKWPTSMAFLGPNDILVLEKNEGTVRRIVDGKMLPNPVLDVNVANKFERGMLGIAIAKHPPPNGPTYVFLYYTESKVEGSDVCYKEETKCKPAGDALGNRLYRYELVGNKLVNPKLLLDLPADENQHNGGQVIIGPDQNVYLTIGDINHQTKAANYEKGPDPDGTAGILRIDQDGKPVGNGIIGNKYPVNLYYAYGVRNSFGMDFDPVTHNLWATEAGLYYVDELNLVKPGFNSGWQDVDGMASRCMPKICEYLEERGGGEEEGKLSSSAAFKEGLVDFDGKGTYSEPKFVWEYNPTPTAVKFLNSDKLGKQYQNDLFVGDFNHGSLYDFKLNKDRTDLVLGGGPLADKVSKASNEEEGIIFGKEFGEEADMDKEIKKSNDFGGITDIEVGPYDGYLYILTFLENSGTIYRIVPK